MPDPKLAEVINPKLALQRRLEAEGQVPPALPELIPPPPAVRDPRFGKQWTPEEQIKQKQALAAILTKLGR